ncbi:MAG: ThiF family adenylyltransferase [Solirubrobacterales bacterium]
MSPNVRVVEGGDVIALVTEDDALMIEPAVPGIRTVLTELRGGCGEETLAACLGPQLAARLAQTLRERQLLLDAPLSAEPVDATERQAGWLALHVADPAEAQRRLARAHVAIVGVGGIGSVLLQHLAAAGVGRFSLLDPDVVAPGDLNRQYLFRRGDVGRPKVDAAAEAVPDATVRRWRRAVGDRRDLDVLRAQPPDLLALAADSPLRALETIVAGFAADAGVSLTMAATGLERGYWGPTLIPGETACLSCWRADADAGLDPLQSAIASDPGIPTPFSFGPVNSLVASLLARDAVLLLAGASDVHSRGARVVVKTRRLHFVVRGCAPCSCWNGGRPGG